MRSGHVTPIDERIGRFTAEPLYSVLAAPRWGGRFDRLISHDSMKLAALCYFSLLVYVHQVRGVDGAIGQPLCSFRDGEFGLLGYALFCAVALVGAVYTFGLRRFGEPQEAANTLGGGLLLLIVVATPSRWPLHDASALVLLGSIYVHYAIVLSQRPGRVLMLVHLGMPLLLAAAIGFHSYGLWQKGMIGYFVAVAVVHHHVAANRARRGALSVNREHELVGGVA